MEDILEMPSMEVVKLNVTDQEIAKMRSEYMGLTINGIEDKAGYKKVYESRQVVKKTRTGLVKFASELKEKALAWQRKVNGEKDRVVSELETIEAYLQGQEDAIDEEKARIKQEEEDREAARIQARIDALAAYGFAIDYATITSIDDPTFDKVLANAKAEYEKELARKEEEEKQAEVERQRLKAEREELELLRAQKAEQDRVIREQQAEIEKQKVAAEKAAKQEEERIRQKAQAAEEERVYQEKKAADAKIKEQKDKAFEIRKQQLIDLGFRHDGVDFSLTDTWSCFWEQVYNPTDEYFAQYVLDIKDAIFRREQRLAAEEESRLEAIERARLDGIETERKAAQAKAEQERQAKIEAERQASLRPDKEKLQSFSDGLSDLKIPAVTNPAAQEIVNEITLMINKMQAHIIRKIKAL